MQKKIQKKFFVFEILGSKLVASNCLSSKEISCHRHPVCQETVLRFCISLTETFCKTVALTTINKYCKGAAMEISTVFARVYHVALGRIHWNGSL